MHEFLPWRLIRGILVLDEAVKKEVEEILQRFPEDQRCPVAVHPKSYYA